MNVSKMLITLNLIKPSNFNLVNKNLSKISNRFLCTSTEKAFSNIKSEEIKIPVPWGHISCVRWGPEDKQPILALHGWQDNAGTWKPLIPHLSPDTSILAIDNPGHGHSSWYPPGMFYSFSDNPIILRRIVKYFGWKSVSLLGHSMGAVTSFSYASLYPSEVDFLILIDSLNPMLTTRKNIIERVSSGVDAFLKTDARNIAGVEPPSYTIDELIERWCAGSHNSMDKDKCKYLLERAITASSTDPQKYYFKRDSRLKHNFQFEINPENVLSMTERMKCPILNIKFLSAPYFQPKEKYMEIVNMIKSFNNDFEVQMLPGTHHGHLNNPEVIAPCVTSFIRKYQKS